MGGLTSTSGEDETHAVALLVLLAGQDVEPGKSQPAWRTIAPHLRRWGVGVARLALPSARSCKGVLVMARAEGVAVRSDPALRFIFVATVIASLVMAGGVVWSFANGEVRGAITMVVVLIIGYAAMGLAWVARQRKG